MMDTIKKVLAQDRFCVDVVGIELIEVSLGRARAKLEINEGHLNGLGIIQGGAIFTLADYALAAASNSHGTAAVLVSSNIAYFTAVSKGTLYAEAIEESFHSKLAIYTVRVTNSEGSLVALMQATVYRKREQLSSIGNGV
jgi:acyl-CoA thioesterase